MNSDSRIRTIIDFSATIFLSTYLLIVLSRWFHPATFTATIEITVLVIALTLLVIRHIADDHNVL